MRQKRKIRVMRMSGESGAAAILQNFFVFGPTTTLFYSAGRREKK
jgi:hypothetical protein